MEQSPDRSDEEQDIDEEIAFESDEVSRVSTESESEKEEYAFELWQIVFRINEVLRKLEDSCNTLAKTPRT